MIYTPKPESKSVAYEARAFIIGDAPGQLSPFPHPNADTLSIVSVLDFNVVIKTADFPPGSLVAYVEPDTILPNGTLVRAKSIRGVTSVGLLLPITKNVFALSSQVRFAALGLKHFNPKPECGTGRSTGKNAGPYKIFPYHIEQWSKFKNLIPDGAPIIITEKLHGANARVVFAKSAAPEAGGLELFIGSHRTWLSPEHPFVSAVLSCPQLLEFLQAHPGVTAIGEVFGPKIQSLHYGLKSPTFAVFELLNPDFSPFHAPPHAIPDVAPFTVPTLFVGPCSNLAVELCTSGPSTIPSASHLREGCVIENVRTGVKLKSVSSAYYLCQRKQRRSP